MKWVTIVQNFKHDGESYFVDERLHIDDTLAAHICGAGWAVADGDAPAQVAKSAEVVLEVQDGKHSSKARIK